MLRKRMLNLFLMLMLFISGLGFVACEKEHKPKAVWSSNEEIHWHDCNACDEEHFDEGEHSYIDAGETKACRICGAKKAYTADENFDYWIEGRNDALGIMDNYTMQTEIFIYKDGEYNTRNADLESRSGNKFYRVSESEGLYMDSSWLTLNKDIEAIKEVKDGEVTRTKKYQEQNWRISATEMQTDKKGSYVEADSAEKAVRDVPGKELIIRGLNKGSTFAEIKENASKHCDSTDLVTFELRRDAMGAVEFFMFVRYNYTRPLIYNNPDAGTYEENGFYSYKFIVHKGKLTDIEFVENCDYIYEDTSRNYTRSVEQNTHYSYNNFDNTFYNNISVETETTES